MAISDDLPALVTKISAALAVRPEVFITHRAELSILKMMTSHELERFAAEHAWRLVRRLGGRQIEFYKDAGARPAV